MRDGGSPRRSGSESGSMATPDDDKYNKPRRPDAEERLWLGMPVNVLKERMGVLAGLMVDYMPRFVRWVITQRQIDMPGIGFGLPPAQRNIGFLCLAIMELAG